MSWDGSGAGDLAAKVKEVQRSGPQAKEAWSAYTTLHGQGTRDPSKHTAEFLQGFLDNFNAGMIDTSGAGAGPLGAAGWGGDSSQEMLVARVKELQRTNPTAKEQWVAFTDLNGAGTRDPSKHPADFLQGFIDHIQSGHQIAPQAMPGMSENPTLAEAFKAMQKKSVNFKNAWSQYCMQSGGGKFDPTKHDTSFHMAFLDAVAALATGGSPSMNPGAPPENPAKRMKDSWGGGMGTSGGMGMGAGSGDPVKDALANRVKAYQRLGTEQKELWSLYADTYLGGVRDPSRHDANTLNEFCVNHEVPEVGMGASMGGGMGGGMGMGPSMMGASNGGGMGMGMGMGADPDKDGLVQRVKAFQKASPENKETWSSFCGATKDPARHSAEKLNEFIQLFSIP